MITKILSKIKVHPLFYIISLITLTTGLFKEFSYIMIIIIIHEIGHILSSIYFKWQIEKIIILPFGGLTLFNEKINKPLKEELIIAISGPLIQILTFSFCHNELILKYHYFLLLFNLLPIIPLDGSKILNVLVNYIMPFKYSHKLIIFISSIVTAFLCFSKFNLVTLIVFSFLFFKIINEIKNHNNLFNKFLIERYLYDLNFKKRRIIKNKRLDCMFRDHKHLFYIDNKYHSEHQILQKRFDI